MTGAFRGLRVLAMVAVFFTAGIAHSRPAQPSWLGVYVGNTVAEIIGVLPDTPAHRAGLASGDIVRRIGRRPVATAAEMIAAVASVPPGTRITVWVERGLSSALEPVEVVVEAKPSPSEILRKQFVGEIAADFELAQEGGGVIRLSDLAGEVVVLNFFDPDDRACIATLHTLAELRARGAVVLLVSRDGARAMESLRRAGVRLPVVIDGRDSLRIAYNGHQGQLLVVVNRDRRIAHLHVGAERLELERAFDVGLAALSPLSASVDIAR